MDDGTVFLVGTDGAWRGSAPDMGEARLFANASEMKTALNKIAALDNYSRAESLESQIGEPVGYGEALGRIEAATIAKAALKALGEEVGGG